MKKIVLTQDEIAVLNRQDPATEGDGGWQGLLVDLQERVNRATGEIALTDEHQEKIPRYAFKYNKGGWESRLKAIFERTLGPSLSE